MNERGPQRGSHFILSSRLILFREERLKSSGEMAPHSFRRIFRSGTRLLRVLCRCRMCRHPLRQNCGLPRRKSSGIFQAGTLPLREVILAVIKKTGGELRLPGPLLERQPFFPLEEPLSYPIPGHLLDIAFEFPLLCDGDEIQAVCEGEADVVQICVDGISEGHVLFHYGKE